MFTIYCRPVPKARPRHGKHGTYTPKRTLNFEKAVAEAFRISGETGYFNNEPIIADLRFYFRIPKSMTKKERANLMNCPYYKHRPDLDNLEKSIMDALNGVAYSDDSQIVEKYSAKWYDIQNKGERVEISLKRLK